MRIIGLFVLLLTLTVGVWSTRNSSAQAQGRSNDPNVVMLDNCSQTDSEWSAVGGCPQNPGPGAQAYRGDVTNAEFFQLLMSPLAPGQIIGHPSWRNEPSHMTVKAGQTVRVSNRGGRDHTFTEVQQFGGGFVPLLNGAMVPAPECGANFVPNPDVEFVALGETQRLTDLSPGLHKFQCCIHPWMRGTIRVEE